MLKAAHRGVGVGMTRGQIVQGTRFAGAPPKDFEAIRLFEDPVEIREVEFEEK
jgi:hypothetical protein